MERTVKRKHKVRKARLFTAMVLFVLVSAIGIWGFFQVAENNQIRAANALMQQAIEERTLKVENQVLEFYREEQRFPYRFADFLIYVDEELFAHFDETKVRDVVMHIDEQLIDVLVDKEAALYDALKVLASINDRMNCDVVNGNGIENGNDGGSADFIARGNGFNANIHLVRLHEIWVPSEEIVEKDLLGTFYTYFNEGDTGRNANLQRAAYLINDYVLQPNSIFNMTDTIGPINASNGYTIALVIRDGEFVEGMGGGVCQVSSTLYMAALFAELEIVQRRAHSRLVGYMPPAFDAVLSIPTLNLRFKNTTEYPVTIEAIVDLRNSRITVNLWGTETRPEGRTISFNSVRVATTAEWWTYHLYKYVEYNGTVTRTRANVSAYRRERADQITYEEAVGAEHDYATTYDETMDSEYDDEIDYYEELDTE